MAVLGADTNWDHYPYQQFE